MEEGRRVAILRRITDYISRHGARYTLRRGWEKIGERYLGERKPTAEGLRAYAEAHPAALAPEPRPIYLSPAVRP